MDFLAGGRARLFGRRAGKRRSGRRLFQETWPLDFEGFPASAGAESNQEEADLGRRATHVQTIKRRRGDRGAERNRTAIKPCQRREVYCHCATGFSRARGKNKRRYPLWNSGSRPQRHGHKSLFTGRKLHRCQRLCSWVRCERSIYREDFLGAVNSFTRCG